MKSKVRILLPIAFFALFVFSCKEDEPSPPEEVSYNVILISTSFGDMYAYLYDSTPLHKANFEKLADEGYFNETEFHRVVKNFVIQGGDPNSKDADRTNDGSGGPGYTIPAEIDSSKYKHKYGALGAARTNNPEKASSGSQFYIVTNLAGTAFLDGNYTVFGELLGGFDIAKTIEGQPKNSKDLPNDRIPMTVKRIQLTVSEMTNLGLTIPQ
jgi:cyclophilin family peptidyl-prolyl cis-trans isomerase